MLVDTLDSEFDKKPGAARKRALIIRLGAIGDVIMAIPAARALHARGFEIHWACGKAVRSLLECYSWVHLIPVDDAALLKGSLSQRIKEIVRFWGWVAPLTWDLAAILYNDPRYRILTLPVRSRRRVALSKQARASNLIAARNYTDEFARLLLGLQDGCRPDGFAPLRPDTLPPCPLPPKTAPRRIAIVPGGASNLVSQQILRRWPVENYVELAAALLERGWEVVLLGGADDAWVLPHFQGRRVTNCIGKVSLPEVISICDSCDGVISHDTGPLHLAGLSNACLVGLFGPTNPGHFLPRRANTIALWGGQQYACRPCHDGRSFAQCQSPECIRELTPKLVLGQLDHLLETQSRGMSQPWQILSR